MADKEKVKAETEVEGQVVVPAIILGWLDESGDFVMHAPNLEQRDVVYLLNHALAAAVAQSSPNRPPKKRIHTPGDGKIVSIN